MTQEQYIEKFKKKQNFETATQIDDRVWAFDGYYFDLDDIQSDIDRVIPPGRILLYHNEAANGGHLPSYSEWLTNLYGE